MDNSLTKFIALREILCKESNVVLRPYQTSASDIILDEVLKGEGAEIVLYQARQSGKTETVAMTLLTLVVGFPTLLGRGFNAGIFAPAFSQATQVARQRLYERFSSVKLFLEQFGVVMLLGDAQKGDLFIIEDLNSHYAGRVRIFSVAPAANIKGATLDLAVIEQVEHVDASKMKGDIFPMLSATGGVRLLAGTTSLTVENEYFYEVITNPERQAPPRGVNPKGSIVFSVDAALAARFAPKYGEYVARERDRLGANSDEFRTAYNLEWVTLRNKFIERDEFDRLAETSYKPDLALPRFVGWDVAHVADRSVMTIVERDGMFRHHVLAWKVFEGTDWEKQLNDGFVFFETWKPKALVIDSVGQGDPILEFARKWCRGLSFPMRVEGYKYDAPKKDAINKLLDTEFRNDRIRFPADSVQNRELQFFREEFLALDRHYRGDLLALDHPVGGHNDFCSSLELALWASLKVSFTGVWRETDVL